MSAQPNFKRIGAGIVLAAAVVGGFAYYKGFTQITRQKKVENTTRELKTLRDSLSFFKRKNGAFPRDPRVLPASILPVFPHLNLPGVVPTTEVEYYDDTICEAAGGLQVGSPIKLSALRLSGKWGYVADPTSKCDGFIFIDAKTPAGAARPYTSY